MPCFEHHSCADAGVLRQNDKSQHETTCYEKGEGVEVNPREALRWYRLAKRWGNEDVDEAIARMKQVVKKMP